MSRASIVFALAFVFLLVIGGSQFVQPVRGVEANAPAATPTPSSQSRIQGTIPSTPTSSPTGVAVYLPVVPSDLAQPTSTPCSALGVQNPSFENGFSGWTTGGVPEITAKQASDGSHSAVLGGYNLANDSLGQTFSVPPWATFGTLTGSFFLITGDTPGTNGGFPGIYDKLVFSVLDPNLNVLTSVQTDNTQPESKRAFTFLSQSIPNVTAFEGSVMTVQVVATTDSSYPSLWYVDNVQVTFGCGPAPAAKVFRAPTPDSK